MTDERFNVQLWETVIGSVAFHLKNGRSEHKNRPLSKWWEKYMGQSTPQRIEPVPAESGLDQWWYWSRRSFVPRALQLARIFRVDPIEFLTELIEGVEPSRTETPATVEARIREQESV